MPERKTVTVHYRRIVGDSLTPIEFKASYDLALANQIDGVPLATNDAARKTRNSENELMVLLSPEITEKYCFGVITVFKEGDVAIAEDHDNGQVSLSKILLDEKETAIKGSTFFMVKGSHAAIINHDSTARYLRDYLAWFLRAPIGNLAQDTSIGLSPTVEIDGKSVNLGEIKAVKIRADSQVVDDDQDARSADHGDGERSFARMIERHPLSPENVRDIFYSLGVNDGRLHGISDNEFQDLQFELLIKKKEGNRIQAIPDVIVDTLMNEGLERAAEFETDTSRRRGGAVVLSYASEIEIEDPYYTIKSVKAALWNALSDWENRGMLID